MDGENGWHRSREELLSKYCCESIVREKVHRLEYQKNNGWLTWFQVPIIVISALNGGAQLLSKSFPDIESTIITATACCSLFVSILSSIQAHMKIGERTAQHAKSRADWLHFYNQIRGQLVLAPELRVNGEEFCKDIANQYEKLFENSPSVSGSILGRVKKDIEKAGNQDFVIPCYLNGFSPVRVFEDSYDNNSE